MAIYIKLISGRGCELRILLPKANNPTSLVNWRPIGLVPVLARWFLAVVIKLLQKHIPPSKTNQLGFTPGKQCMEGTESIRITLQKASEWGIPCVVTKGDIHKAFGSFEWKILDRALLRRGASAAFRATVLRELLSTSLTVDLQCIVSEGISVSEGGRQGCSSTFTLWNTCLDYVFTKTLEAWEEKKRP